MNSVCMATFNGQRFIEEQLKSILSQLEKNDEVILVDDCSTDKTIELVNKINDNRVSVFENKINIGPIKSFEKAIMLAKGDYIFLSDQDDVWQSDKVTTILRCFNSSNADIVVHDAKVVNANLQIIEKSWDEYNSNHFRGGVFGIILKNPYTGALMTFKKEIKSQILPFPDSIPMHDSWIVAKALLKKKRVFHYSEPLELYRRHGDNVTGSRGSIVNMISNRLRLIYALSGI